MTGREIAVQALLYCEKQNAWSDAYLNALLLREKPDSREAALGYRIFAGVLQNREACDWYLKPYIRGKLQPEVRAILRTAVYQLVFLDKIPVSAAVNEAVELAKRKTNPGAAKLVNAVLRRLTSKPLPGLPDGDDAESLSIRYSHPAEWTKYYVNLLGAEKTRALLECNNRPAPTCFRVNRLKAVPENALYALREDGIEALPMAVADFFTAERTGAVTELRAFREGLVTVQDPAAALPALAADVKPGMRVLDACAAPGGKSFLLAQQMENSGSILSCDLHENKLRHIREGAERLGVGIIETKAQDAKSPDPSLKDAFDVVLADVPCSGLGVVRKKPEIRYKTLAEIAALPETQSAILEGLSAYVKPGGVLLYSTCTLVTAENEAVTEAFLAKHPEFSREPLPLPEPFGVSARGERTIWPFEYDTDGFFLCRMRKKI